jgi:hypothetical protein
MKAKIILLVSFVVGLVAFVWLVVGTVEFFQSQTQVEPTPQGEETTNQEIEEEVESDEKDPVVSPTASGTRSYWKGVSGSVTSGLIPQRL